jgi:hypothetical protein
MKSLFAFSATRHFAANHGNILLSFSIAHIGKMAKERRGSRIG